MEFAYDWIASDFGHILVAATQNGVCRVHIGQDRSQMMETLKDTLGVKELRNGSSVTHAACNALEFYLAGRTRTIDVPLDIDGTDFQLQVWQGLLAIPYGKTVAYSTLAEQVGHPQAVRAVGSACGSNPLAIIIPCHRIIGKNGTMNGYYWGVDVKRALLGLEKEFSYLPQQAATAALAQVSAA